MSGPSLLIMAKIDKFLNQEQFKLKIKLKFKLNRLFETSNLKTKKRAIKLAFYMLAEWTGLEPATPGVTGRYSNQLNYHSSFLAA